MVERTEFVVQSCVAAKFDVVFIMHTCRRILPLPPLLSPVEAVSSSS